MPFSKKLFFDWGLIMPEPKLEWLIDAFTRSLSSNGWEQKWRAFDELRKYFYVFGAPQDTIDLVLISCTTNDDIRHIGVHIAQLASPDVRAVYRAKLIEAADCRTLLYLTRITDMSLTKDEILRLGLRMAVLSVEIEMIDLMRLFIAALDTFEMTEFDYLVLSWRTSFNPCLKENVFR